MTATINQDLKVLLIKKQTVFSKLTDSEAQDLAELLIEKHYKAGETIVTEGAIVDCVYLIVRGKADVRHVTKKNDEVQIESLATLQSGQAIGLNDSGFYSLTGKRTATVVALSDMDLLYLSVPRFHGFALVNSRVNELMRKNASAILNMSRTSK